MKLCFVSNFLNHHQLPFCQCLCSHAEDEFFFVATEEIPRERLELGYENMNKKYPFVICSYEDIFQKEKAIRICGESDVVIIGSAPDVFIMDRVRKDKLTFKYQERIFKDGWIHAFDPRVMRMMWREHIQYRDRNLRLLCASGYTAGDMALFKAYPNKMYRWGYFPEVKSYDVEALMAQKEKEVIELLWVGRFLGWKHPEEAVIAAEFLKEQGIDFRMNMIGTGEKLAAIHSMIKKKGLDGQVFLLGSMSPERVRHYMEHANIFLFTSDYHEGWGAVLNESMNSACAVVANHAIGSVPYLIKNGYNGSIYKNGDLNALKKNVLHLCQHRQLCRNMGKNAYDTMKTEWNPGTAAKQFRRLCQSILKGQEVEISRGPCSKAPILKQRDAYDILIRQENK